MESADLLIPRRTFQVSRSHTYRSHGLKSSRVLSLNTQSLLSARRSMARILSQTLIRESATPLIPPSKSLHLSPSSRLLNLRNRSNRSGKSQSPQLLIEVDLEPDGEVEVFGIRRLEDAIHGIIIRRSAPDWLPFVPGASYWVPPRRRSLGLSELVGKIGSSLSEEETLSLTSVRGWPSAAYFVEGVSAQHVKTAHHVKTKSKKTPESEDEEG